MIYLDRPIVPGEYVRISFNSFEEDAYGRVESIGIRSTKIRIAARNTLIIAPNSIMIAKEIENISRGKKVMALLHQTFLNSSQKRKKPLSNKFSRTAPISCTELILAAPKLPCFSPRIASKPGLN